MKRFAFVLTLFIVPGLFLGSCGWIEDTTDDLTTREESADVTLDNFSLSAAPPRAAPGLSRGPWEDCSSAPTSLATLLAENDVSTSRLKGIDIETVTYTVSSNTTADDIDVRLRLTDPTTMELVEVAKTTIPQGTGNPGPSDPIVVDFATVAEDGVDGRSIVQHYLDNRSALFDYCVEGPSDVPTLSLSVEVTMGIRVTIELL